MMNKVLLFDTAIATSNLGDEIIFESVKQGLEPIIKNSSVFRLGTHIENYSLFQMLLHKVHPLKKLQMIDEDVDAKFICGTNLLMGNLLHPRPQFMLNCFNQSLYFDSVLVGVGRTVNFKKFKNQYTENLYKRVFSKKYFHSVRDEETKEVLESIGVRCLNTGCPTLWMMTKEKCRSIPQDKAENVVFSVSGYENQLDEINDKYMIDVLLRNYKEKYAWIQTTEDEAYLRRLIDVEKNNIKMVYSLHAFAEILDQGNIDYVGTRLHGGIFAMQHDVRSLIVSIDERAIGFHKSTNLPIIKRNEISHLEERLRSRIKTDIFIREKEISEFLAQFS